MSEQEPCVPSWGKIVGASACLVGVSWVVGVVLVLAGVSLVATLFVLGGIDLFIFGLLLLGQTDEQATDDPGD